VEETQNNTQFMQNVVRRQIFWRYFGGRKCAL